jgi:hypothetical protein
MRNIIIGWAHRPAEYISSAAAVWAHILNIRSGWAHTPAEYNSGTAAVWAHMRNILGGWAHRPAYSYLWNLGHGLIFFEIVVLSKITVTLSIFIGLWKFLVQSIPLANLQFSISSDF